jgi:rhomboid protease GluP
VEPSPTPARRPSLLARLRAAPATALFVALDLAVFGWVALHGSTTDTETLVRFGALEKSTVWAGEGWRLLTAAFLHIGPIHLAANLFFGTPWCLLVEGALGTRRFAALYLVGAIGASAASLLVMRFTETRVSAGASGAIFAVIGASLSLHRRALGSWRAFFASGVARTTLLNLGVFAVISIWLPFDQGAHAGGFVTGAWMGWLLSRPASRRSLAWPAFGAALAVLIAAAARPDPGWRENADAIAAIATALEADDPARARALLKAARAANQVSPGLDYYEGVLLAIEGDLDAARATLRALADGPPGDARRAARRTLDVLCRRGDAGSCAPPP